MSEPPRKKYHLRTVFHSGPDGIVGADGRAFGFVEAWHRRACEGSPYCIPNEYICGEIGRFLRLPIPAFGITVSELEQYFFSSLNFNFGRKEEIPPIQPDLTWHRLPNICTGILLFDILVANCDRHDKNLAVDSTTMPKSILVYDHDQALFGGGDPALSGVSRLDALDGRLGITNGGVTGGNRHCLLDEVNSAEHISEWLHKIYSLPDWFISGVCQSARAYGLSGEEADRVCVFLSSRRKELENLLKTFRNEFSNVSDWPWEGALL